MLTWLIAIGALLACLLVILKYFMPRKPKAAVERSGKRTEPSAPVLESQTRVRMVHKLLNQGWKPDEVARELKLSHKEVERIVSLLKSGGYDQHT